MSKRFIIFIILLTAAIVGAMLYFVFKKPPKNITQSQKPEKISSKSVSFPILSGEGNSILYYNVPEAVFYQINLSNKHEEALSEMLSFIESVNWSGDGTKIVLKARNIQAAKTESFFYSPDRPYEEIVTWFYDFKTKNKSALNKGIGLTSWDGNNKKIIYQYIDRAKATNNLNISDPDGKNWKKIVDLKENIVYLSTIAPNEIVYFERSEKKGSVEQGETGSYSDSVTTNNFNVIKTDGSGKRTIKLPITVSVNKITWSFDGKSAIVATRETDKKTDSFYKINLETSEKTEIKYSFNTPIDAKNPMLTRDGKTLYFTSDDFLYKINL